MAHALLFGDLHLHNHKKSSNRLMDCIDVIDWIFNTAKTRGIKYILFGGDLLHERQKIDVLNYIKIFERFMFHMADKPFEVYLLIGNHDMYHRERWDVNSVKPLSALPGVHVIEEPKTINIGGVDVDFLPFTEDPIGDIKKLKKTKNRDLLIAHMAVDGAYLNSMYGIQSDVIVEYDSEMFKVTPTIFTGWRQVFLSHYHCGQILAEGVEYIGSPLELSFGEAFQPKHIIDLNLDTFEKEYIVNDFSPKHYIIRKEEVEKYDIREKDFVRIVVDNISAVELVEMRKDLINKYKMASLEIKMKPKDREEIDQEQQEMERAKNVLLQVDDMLEKWIEINGVPDGLNKDKLKEWGKKICEKENVGT